MEDSLERPSKQAATTAKKNSPRRQKKLDKLNKMARIQQQLSRDTNADAINHQKFLMPEMNEFLDSGADKQNYMTQDEAGEPRIANRRKPNRDRRPRSGGKDGAASDMDVAQPTGKMAKKNFTPGRIRAGKMGLNSMTSPPNHQSDNLFSRSMPRQQQFKNKQMPDTHVESVEATDSVRSLTGVQVLGNDYLLPEVKMKKKKKRSPSAVSQGTSSVMQKNHHMSSSRISNAPMKVIDHTKDPKLRATLDQSLHYVPTKIEVPKKQTLFYDDTHASAITEQQM